MSGLREVWAVVICLAVGTAIMFVVVALPRLVQPGSDLVRLDRLPAWWHRMTRWARSRSLRLWCPDPRVAKHVASHLRTDTGRRLRRLGVAMVDHPAGADVVVVDQAGAAEVAVHRGHVPGPCASIVLADAADESEFHRAIVELAAALRWAESGEPR